MKSKQILLIALVLFSSICATCQKQFSGWLADFNTVRINNKFSVHTDFQLRSTDRVENIQTLLLRAGLNYHISKRFIVTGGYAFIHNRRVINGISGYADEHRLWEQLIFNHALVFGRHTRAREGTMQHRLRLEQRFIPQSSVVDNSLQNEGRVYANRLRYFFRNVTPLVPWSSAGSAPFLAIQNEVFLNIGDKSPVNGEPFDQNRLYVALGYRFNKKFDLEAGYMNQYVNGTGDAFTNNHIMQVATYLRL